MLGETHEKLPGIPPHIKSLVDIASIKVEQSKLVQQVFEKVMEGMGKYFEDRQIGGGQLTEARITQLIGNFMAEPLKALGRQIQTLVPRQRTVATNDGFAMMNDGDDEVIIDDGADQQSTTGNTGTTTTTATNTTTVVRNAYPLRYHKNGVLSRLPEDFQFPKAGIYDLWLKWNI